MQILYRQTKAGTLEEQLQDLIAEARRYPAGHFCRQRCLTQIIRLILRSQKLWKEGTPYYADALQQTWLYFCQNICEATTGEQYDSRRGSVTTWLNSYLRWRLQDLRHQVQVEAKWTIPAVYRIGDRPWDRVAQLSAQSDVPPILDETRLWALQDPWGTLGQVHIQRRPDVTAQFLILRRLPPETRWDVLSKELNLSVSTLSSFYQRHCVVLLRRFGQKQGYL